MNQKEHDNNINHANRIHFATLNKQRKLQKQKKKMNCKLDTVQTIDDIDSKKTKNY